MRRKALRCWAEVDLSAIRHNLSAIRSLLPRGCEVMGVVKANAYGHGLADVSRRLAREGVRRFLVANAAEAEALLRAVPRAWVLLAGPALPDEVEWAVRQPRLAFAISSEEELRAIARVANRARVLTTAHLKVDTGMGRLGCRVDDAAALIARAATSRGVRVEGVFTHLANAEADPAECQLQFARLLAAREAIARRGFRASFLHLHNSAAVVNLPADPRLTHARPGIALYGYGEPRAAWRRALGRRALRLALAWKARVALVREVAKGSRISYGGTFRAPRRMRVGVLPFGYADGFSRRLSNLGEVLVRGRRCRVLGRVTMDMTMVDLSRLPAVERGEEVVLIGRQGQEEITAREIADRIGTISYEVLCGIGARVPRLTVG